MEKIEFRAMGSQMMAALERDGPRSQAALSRVPGWFEEWEDHLSRFRPESELNTLNQKSGRWVEVSPVMWEMLITGQRAERQSEGLVTPALQGVLEAYGYDRSFELVATFGTNLNITELRAAPLPGLCIELDAEHRRVRLQEGTRLDFGGIAKGWAADRALNLLKPFGAGLVDAGGDIATRRPEGETAAWPVGVTDPFAPEEELELLALQGEAVATSGRDIRRWVTNETLRHHIIDPRNSEPAASRVLAATVIAPTTIEAEVGAKCALILGEFDGVTWLDARPGYAGMLVLEDGDVAYSHTFQNYIWSN